MDSLNYLFYIKVIIQLLCFCLAFYSLDALNFEKFLRSGRVFKAQLLYFLIACSIAYLSSQFIISMILKLNF